MSEANLHFSESSFFILDINQFTMYNTKWTNKKNIYYIKKKIVYYKKISFIIIIICVIIIYHSRINPKGWFIRNISIIIIQLVIIIYKVIIYKIIYLVN